MLEKNAGKIRGKNRIIMGKIHGGNGWRMICSVDFPHVFPEYGYIIRIFCWKMDGEDELKTHQPTSMRWDVWGYSEFNSN